MMSSNCDDDDICHRARLYLGAMSSEDEIDTKKALPPIVLNDKTTIEEYIYSVHRRMIELEKGSSSNGEFSCGGLAGYKMGAVNLLPGVPCLFGPLWKRYITCHPAQPSLSPLIHCHTVEAELAFVTRKALPPTSGDDSYTMEQVWDAIDYVVPVIEMCASRATSGISLEQRLVDGLMTGGVYMGKEIISKDQFRHVDIETISKLLSSVESSMTYNNNEERTKNEGTAASCPMGGPLESVTWLANRNGWDAGQLLLSGMTSKAQAKFKCGDTITATYQNGIFGENNQTISFQWKE